MLRKSLVICFILFGQKSNASVFGEENGLLSAIEVNTLISTMHLSDVLKNMTTLVRSANESLSIARQSYRAVQIIRNYNVETLKKDATSFLYQKSPEFRELQREIGLFKGEIKTMDDGTFFSHWGIYDDKVMNLIKAQAKHHAQSTFLPIIFPEIYEKDQRSLSNAEALVLKRINDSGLAAKVAWEQTALSVLAREVAILSEDAKEKDSIDIKLKANEAIQGIQQTESIMRIANHLDVSAAKEQSAIEQERAFRALIKKSIANDKNIMKPFN